MMSEDSTNTAVPGQSKARFETTAQAYLELLSLRGIEYFFANAGTDFASIVDAFAYRQQQGDTFPRPITVPHETPLISMAHGYYMLTGKPQAAMVHVGVGTANGLGALMAAQRPEFPFFSVQDGHPSPKAAVRLPEALTSTGVRRLSTRPGCCGNT